MFKKITDEDANKLTLFNYFKDNMLLIHIIKLFIRELNNAEKNEC